MPRNGDLPGKWLARASEQATAPDHTTSLRFGRRVSLEVFVRLRVEDREVGHGFIRNASVSGAYIETSAEIPLHTNLVVRLEVAGDVSLRDRALPACVVRTDADGLGIEWRDMGSIDVVDLLERAADPGQGTAAPGIAR